MSWEDYSKNIKDNPGSHLIVAHSNSLRAIIKILKDISNKDIINLNIPTGFPYIFEFDNNLDVKKDYFLGNQ